MEAVRQSAAQRRSGGAGAAVAAGMDGPAAGLAVDLAGARHHARFPSFCASIVELLRKPDEVLLRQHLAPSHIRPAALHADGVRARLSPVRGVLQPGRHRAHGLAHAGHPQRTARMESLGATGGEPAKRSRGGLAASFRSMWVAPAIAAAAAITGGGEPGGVGAGGADTAALVRRARHRVVDQPPARSPQGAPDGRADALPARACAQDLGILRDLRRPGRPLAAARQLSGYPLPQSRIAPRRPTWGWRCWRICPPTTSATCRPDSSSSARRRRCTRWKAWSATGATSTTGTTRRLCSRCRRCTSPRWTAAISPAIC